MALRRKTHEAHFLTEDLSSQRVCRVSTHIFYANFGIYCWIDMNKNENNNVYAPLKM